MIKYLVLILLAANLQSLAQTSVQTVVEQLENAQKALPREKVYIHIDKPSYMSGDTLWLKAYVLDGTFLTAADQSGLLYLELSNDTGKVVQRRMLPLTQGLGSGSLVLDKKEVPHGSYIIKISIVKSAITDFCIHGRCN